MRLIEVRGLFRKNVINVYESIKELPIERHHEFQKLVLQDLGIGSDLDAVAKHFSVFHNLLVNNKSGDALMEAKNLHNAFFYILEGINIKSFCFVVMVESINGEKFNDLSESGIKKHIKKISQSGLTQGMVDDVVEDLKKKLKANFEPIFLINTETQGSLIHTLRSNEKSKHN